MLYENSSSAAKESETISINGANNKKTVEIFWTGGFDSTFRVLQLSRMSVKIKPYYLSDNRKSEQRELSAIKKITKILMDKLETRAEFSPLEIVDRTDRKNDNSITEAYRRLKSKNTLGTQYEWLSWFAKSHRGIELSVEKSEGGHVRHTVGHFTLVSDETIGDYYVLDTERSNQDVCTVFSNFHFPLVTLTKLDMKKYYLEWGCKDVMDLTWFCFTPNNGKPCGLCHPCNQAITDGMTERFTKTALLKNRLRFIFKVPGIIKGVIKTRLK